ncbi:MAG: hypothetical protein K8Q91_03690 [Candidatus Vogelbacteria bacterium]|nr:hypothetical protein [Candidatus Vogelbacteria bacterium]
MIVNKSQGQLILIATGIYPPAIGGPAQYAVNVEREWRLKGFKVVVKTFTFEYFLPTGIRHLFYLGKILPTIWRADFIFILDTWSVALPVATACLLLRKKFVVRTGGDFLWESYVERTKKPVLLRDFYKTEMQNLSFKERIIFKTTRFVLSQAKTIIFSTKWQQSIWLEPYCLSSQSMVIVSNYLGTQDQKKTDSPEVHSDFILVSSSRGLVWKNKGILEKALAIAQKSNPKLRLFDDNVSYQDFMKVIEKSQAIILVSLGDISPNMILDGLRFGKPFVCTKECGLYENLKDLGLWVDPLDSLAIAEAMVEISKPEVYRSLVDKINSSEYRHSWVEIADEIMLIMTKK